jgi:hypothetical protein
VNVQVIVYADTQRTSSFLQLDKAFLKCTLDISGINYFLEFHHCNHHQFQYRNRYYQVGCGALKNWQRIGKQYTEYISL